jgi:hypothetical protein
MFSARPNIASLLPSDTPLTLTAAGAPALPPLHLPQYDPADLRSESGRWKNIAPPVRAALGDVHDALRAIHGALAHLGAAVSRRAGYAETAAALSRAPSAEQLGALARFVARDVVGRLEAVAGAQVAAGAASGALDARLASLEGLVAAQDAQLRAVVAEVTALRGRPPAGLCGAAPGAALAGGRAATVDELEAALRGAPSAAGVAAAVEAGVEAAARHAAEVVAGRAAAGEVAELRAGVDDLRARLVALARAADAAMAANGAVAAASGGALTAVRERVKLLEGCVGDVLEGLGAPVPGELARGRSASPSQLSAGGAPGSTGRLVAAAAETALRGRLAALGRSLEALVAGAKERLSGELATSLGAAVAGLREEVGVELRRARSAGGGGGEGLRGALRAAAEDAARAALAPTQRLVMDLAAQVAAAGLPARGEASAGAGEGGAVAAAAAAAAARAEAAAAAATATAARAAEAAGAAGAGAGAAAEEAAAARVAAAAAAAAGAALSAELGVLKEQFARAAPPVRCGGGGAPAPSTPQRRGGGEAAALASPPPTGHCRGADGAGGAVVAGRWVWKSRRLTAAAGAGTPRFVVWDAEAVNTLPGALQWEDGGDAHVVVAERCGLYRVALGFFGGAPPPSLSLCVDGHAAFTVVGHSPTTLAPAGGVVVHSHPGGTVGGLSAQQFVSLPAGARLSLAFAGNERGQGFLELSKV